MDKRKTRLIMGLMKAVNILHMTAIFGIICHSNYMDLSEDPFYRRREVVFVLMFLACYIFLAHIYSAFEVGMIRIREIFYSQALALLLSDGILLFLTWLAAGEFPALKLMLLTSVCQIASAGIWGILANKVYDSLYVPKKTALMYHETRDVNYLESLGDTPGKFRIDRWIHVSDSATSVLCELEGMDTVIIRGLPSDERNTVLKYCIAKGIEVYQYPKIGDILLNGARQTHLSHVSVMRLSGFQPAPGYLFLKRMGDILLSLIGIIVCSPLLLLTAALVKGYDGGSVLYRQVRLTQNGQKFLIYKFRSMRMDAEKDGLARLASEQDSRVTPVGKFIRAVRLDELPQLFNVLKGEMTLVGPRPERPEIAEAYVKELPEFALRLQVKAGITGYAQVYGKYNSTPYDKLQMDLLYIAHPSLINDLKLLFATVKILFMKESTEGFTEGHAGIPYRMREKGEAVK
ncbi:exopolysaccharide biosynthesis polyprenyl glycosylphosphotransferase [Novisyntrophococcus fermenticellae]|uniref:exopolysaccharide biosynthesis polyprenyl glycosylphosphotransferase n=1 Tax=Novisyntrophococcus fermenticellae TaxID=2068655 RepID=UPI001E2DE2F2|nr:exopolysaccharide biosynthesis polyprenyl glycosylphosphotransferase [Novisyntrophococcus fermenticellae]